MLISNDKKDIKTSFDNEAELEKVVIEEFEMQGVKEKQLMVVFIATC